jgi:hypothetical protein
MSSHHLELILIPKMCKLDWCEENGQEEKKKMDKENDSNDFFFNKS